MLNKIIKYSITHKLVIGLLTFALIILGVYSLRQLPVDAVPDITNNQVQVITNSPTLAAQEVERLITFPIEITMATIPQIEEIRSFSRFGLSVVTIVFEEDVDVYWARQQVNERLAEAQSEIPKEIGKPGIAPLTTGLGEIYQYVITTEPGYEDQYNATELRTIQDWIIRRQLLGTPGVADVSSFGGYLKQYEIAIRPELLNTMNISITEIFDALQTNNQNTGGAYIEKNDKALFIRSEGLVGSLEDIENILVKQTESGNPILIRDVAKVQIGKAIRYGATTRNGEGEVVSAIVMMLKGANSAKVIEDVKEQIATISKTLPEGVVIEPFLDRTKLVDNAIGTVTTNLIEGALIVIFILLLLLGNWRAGLITASVIPLALLFAFSMMHIFGVSANLMSLGAIDFGLIVDGAVIIVEATLFHLGALTLSRKLTQQEMDEEVFKSASKIRNSAAFGEIIILIVYLPILALVGTEGKMFGPMAQTVSFAILGAFLLSLTYVPMMSALVLSKKGGHKKNISDHIMNFFYRLYEPVIKWAMHTRIILVGATLVLFAVAFFIFSTLGGEFIPTLEEGDFAVETRVITGSSLSNTIKATTKAEKILLDNFPEVEQVVSKIGSGEIPTDPMPVEAADLMIILKDKSEWTTASNREDLANKMAEALEVIPGVTFGFQQPIQMRFNELMTGVRQDVAIKIYGEDLEQLSTYANQIGRIAGSVDGAVDMYVEEVTGIPQIVVDYKRNQLAKYGLSIDDVNMAIQSAFAGAATGTVYEGEKRFEMVVRLSDTNRSTISDVQNLYINGSNGEQIPLKQLATVSIIDGPYQIQRDDTQRRIIVAFNVRNRDVESVVNEVSKLINTQVDLKPGYTVSYGGQFENLVEARERLAVAVPLALLLIFILLYFTFGSLKQGVLIFTAIPLSAIGGVFALWLRDMPFSISAGVGFIALFGVAVLNGIVLIAEFNSLEKEGVKDIFQRIYMGTKSRLRPVILTASVASLGFLPMAISQTSGAEVQRPLATVVIGGLITATFLTLVVLPILYYYSEKKFKMKKNKITSVLLFLMMGTAYQANAQTEQKVYQSLDQVLEVALENNPNLKVAQFQTAREQALKGTSFNLPKTDLGVEYGQTNSIADNDTRFSISQTFEFPTVYSRQSKLNSSKVAASKLRQEVVQNDLVAQVSSTYYRLWFLKSKGNVLQRQDSIYSRFSYAAQLRYDNGESNALELATANAELADINIMVQQNEAAIAEGQFTLQNLMNVDDAVEIETPKLEMKSAMEVSNTTDMNVSKNPLVSYYKQQIDVAENERKVASAKRLPDITLGYFNQSFIGTGDAGTIYDAGDRFTGVQLGLSIPLWAKPHTAKITAAKIYKQETEAQLEVIENQTKSKLQSLFTELQKNLKNIEYYRKSGLPQSDVLFKTAQRGFEEGEIGYIEYVQGLNRALTIQVTYLDFLNQYNQTLINIEQLIKDI
ncbi:CusA/CzcA family heavy metal efflux RND transporter [Olleya sp. Hel_I_94]|uniref:CusA/CzcA family heavy metal efflux RND transporter n=1 Tax=Olleya sp. Hel_I_94 TaxID=1250001 RepID=UPI0011AA70D3|nr:CusA/CzcA family heavy metal efflux RND transporter [Olleya sp. Hel_I_94]TVZ49974.1 cobalt-zinc-cadmium resistance protein CzcA [Olleya sp. Hel_I_94]|tara:strand:+ start:1065 stop:5429 length:4365 start_codon:yes stop_codon:yes gene_type:complete